MPPTPRKRTGESALDEAHAEEQFGLELVQYAGRWVAVQDHTVLDNDENLECLLDRLNGERETAEIFQVRDRPTTTTSS
jgi:hypothetical protein